MSKLSRTARFYRKNKKAREKRNEYQKEYNKKPKEVQRRVFDNKKNREFGTYGNYDGKDVSHKGNRIVLERASKNRGSKTATAGDRRARGKKGKGRKNKGNTGGE
tara:strand:- start:384 stop:698 length:315 start_codon:yes stop_codon:yes gene_type:complete